MKCPHCGTEGTDNIVRAKAQISMKSYSRSGLVSTVCCSKPLRVAARISFVALEDMHTEQKCDDWGNPFA